MSADKARKRTVSGSSGTARAARTAFGLVVVVSVAPATASAASTPAKMIVRDIGYPILRVARREPAL
jgi:hypothetical protein